MSLTQVRLNIAPEDLVAEMADAAYRVALEHGFIGPFVDFEIRLWHRLDDVVRRTVEAHAPKPSGESAILLLSGAGRGSEAV